MNALVTVRFEFPNVCNPEDLVEMGQTFEQMVKYLIREEGLFGVVSDDYEILDVKESE